jgi:ectoine hydroxylase-related dioxygenase (phytanoyl-CoA dioxygenase family)|tara:strand:+ start:2638 stop:3435 length:798 start_codon:yes stop_codon:yes gene_type:complete
MALDFAAYLKQYEESGYVSPVPFLSEETANLHRNRLEKIEEQIGSLHYRSKAHTFMTSALELATLPSVLDMVEQMIGPNILLYNVTYIIKEPHTLSHVSWHQDLTYWGLSHDDQVSMWLALSPATAQSGCMKMIPGSHKMGKVEHSATEDDTNVLLQGQTVKSVDEDQSELCPLRPGEATFHHGWTLHASMPNKSEDRRIGLNVQYLATHVRQTKHDHDSAILVRGEDAYQHFRTDIPASSDLDPDSMERQAELERMYVETAGRA